VSGLRQEVLLAPDDGSLGPLLRLADDRLAPGAGYGRHAHRSVDVVAVVLEGTVRHRWRNGAELTAGDVAVLRAGAGLDHDEVAGDGGARILQCYLRAADPGAPPSHVVHRGARGWVEVGRGDARLWVGQVPAGEEVEIPEGLVVVATSSRAEIVAGGRIRADEPATVLVWRLDVDRPAWAQDEGADAPPG
jgi:quercetin 2,3-dioxygenase